MYDDPERSGAIIRRATRADNAALLDLFGDIPMRGSLALTTERGPDLFALYDIQDAHTECWVYEHEGRLLGLGSFILREGYMHGAPVPVTYLGDLRARPEIKGALSRFYGLVFDDFKARTGCEHFYTGVLASNQRALAALTRRSPTRQDQPHYDLMRRFDSVQVQFTHAPKHARSGRLTTRTARADDLDAIINLLHREHRLRPFGYRYDAGELERRLARWPGFDLDHTILAFDRGDRLVGVCTAWDAAPLKRYRVLAYRDEMRAARVAFDLSARLRGHAPLPAPGECFRYAYLANLCAPDRSPEVLDALIAHEYRLLWPRGYHFMMLYMERHDPMRAALTRYDVRALPFHLYSVRSASAPPQAIPPGPSGFEIALA